MARDVTGPWFRASKNTWYATLGGAKVSLKIKGEENREAAVKAWHRLMADGQTATTNVPQVADAPPALTVQELTDLFLADIASRLKPLTVGQYRIDLELFLTRFKNSPANRVATLRCSLSHPTSRSTALRRSYWPSSNTGRRPLRRRRLPSASRR